MSSLAPSVPTIGSRPRVSVGLPVYNGERWIAESIESILSQTFPDFELIICDNASNDGTEEICRRYANADPRVRYLRNAENIGGTRNHNLTAQLARGEYFRWAGHDDRCEPNLLERLVEILDTRPEVVLAYSPSIAIDDGGEPLAHYYVGRTAGRLLSLGRNAPGIFTDDSGAHYPTEGTAVVPSRRFRELMLTRGPCEASHGLVRSDLLRRTRLEEPYTESDRVMLSDLALHGPFHVLHEPLYFKRWHTSNSPHEQRPRQMVWCRPNLVKTGKICLPHWLELVGFAGVVLRARQLQFTERARCALSVPRLVRLRGKGLVFDLWFAATMLLHSRDWRRRYYIDAH
jgi:glycosyltransferase involved in cell wall biosynthesis